MKNVSLLSQKEYVMCLISSVETFVKNLRWRAFFFLNPQEKPTKNKFGFKSLRAAPKIKELQKLEDGLYDIVKNVKFRKFSNTFQRKLKEDRIRIKNESKLIIPADKSSNYYKLTKSENDELLAKEVHKHYKKASEAEVDSIKVEHTEVVTNLEIEDRVFKTIKSKARITLKDHKDDFKNRPKVRLINSCKPQVGKVSKLSLSRIVEEVKTKTSLAQWKNSLDVIKWFKEIKNKKNCSFIILDVCEYYPSITAKLLTDALKWASTITAISEDEIYNIVSAKRSLLYMDSTAYIKKNNSDFDITMGSYDGAESSDLVGLYLLHKVKDLNVSLGCFRDDWLGYSRLTPRQTDLVRKKIIKIFQENGLKIEINVNKKIADFLDITLDMESDSYRPFTKPNHQPV